MSWFVFVANISFYTDAVIFYNDAIFAIYLQIKWFALENISLIYRQAKIHVLFVITFTTVRKSMLNRYVCC